MIIYKATNKVNGKSYIGQTLRPLQRRAYCHKLSSRNGSKTYFHNAIRKYGFDAFGWQVLETCNTKEQLDEMEYHYIRQFNTFCDKTKSGYNLTLGGEGTQLFGNTNGMYGANHSQSTIDKMSKSRKGSCCGDDNPAVKMAGTYLITFPDGHQEEIKNLRGWCRKNSFDRGQFYNMCNGKRDTYKGYRCRRIEYSHQDKIKMGVVGIVC